MLSFDLPRHGERKDNAEFLPWSVKNELGQVADYAFKKRKTVAVRATSIGAYFSLLSFKNYKIEKCLFVSPLLDMTGTIADLMRVSGVTEERLRAEKSIPTNFGQMLSWDYLCFARENPVAAFTDTRILYADGDEVIPRETVEKFSAENHCKTTILSGGEHWLHTEQDERAMGEWERKNIKNTPFF